MIFGNRLLPLDPYRPLLVYQKHLRYVLESQTTDRCKRCAAGALVEVGVRVVLSKQLLYCAVRGHDAPLERVNAAMYCMLRRVFIRAPDELQIARSPRLYVLYCTALHGAVH